MDDLPNALLSTWREIVLVKAPWDRENTPSFNSLTDLVGMIQYSQQIPWCLYILSFISMWKEV